MEQLVCTALPPHPQDQHKVLDVHFHWETIILDSTSLSNLCSGFEDAHVWKVGGVGEKRVDVCPAATDVPMRKES